MQTPSPDLEGALRKSFAVIKQLKQELVAAKLAATQSVQEPIAIVAMSCRFPGGANSPEDFWQSLRDGHDNLSEIPVDRWNWRKFYNPDPTVPGTHYVRHGYFIDRVGDFDPEFFGIAGREAACMDPQQRLLLEISWETLERAALSADQLRGSRTGVFVGIGQNDYAQLQMYGGAPERITPYDGTGISFCFAAARLSYMLGLNGPNLAVDTACSSSLVALHLACNSLANRECDQALAGGSHLIISPEVTIYLSRLKALSADGRSKAFAADADGYGRGEGCGMLLLKRLADAQRDGDPVLAVIRGSAVNHGGAGSGLTVPNGLAQQLLLRQAIERAGLTPADIGWIEAHGTGTALGDPIEVAALGEIFKKEARAGLPLYLSSVKTNIGHLEAAAGIAGVIKAVLALQHGELPPHLHLGTANPHIDWQNHPFHIPTQLTPWRNSPHVVGISAFGLGGTNAHVIIGAADAAASATATPLRHSLPHSFPLLLSARTPEALARQRDAFIAHLETTDSPFPAISQTAALGRRHFEYRLSVAASSAASAATKLRQAVPASGSSTHHHRGAPRIAFLFTGQGSQYCAMGRTLWQQEAVFRSAVEHCASLIEQQADWSPLPFINSPDVDPRIDQTSFTQPTLFALQVGLVSLWRAWGINPDMVIGHSIGEFAAAWCAGVLSLEDAVALVVERGRLMQQLPAGGGMAALRIDAATAGQFIAPFPGLSLAACNAPQAVSIAGPLPELERCLHQIEAAGIACQRLPVSHAFHSSLMQPMLDEFAQTLARTRFTPPTLEFIATGGAAAATVNHPGYWREQIRNPVNFAAAAARLADRPADIVIEIGPSAPLLSLARQSVDLPQVLWLPSLDRHNADALADSLGKLYVAGVDLPWRTIFSGPRQPALLPTYPFQRRRCWVEAHSAPQAGFKPQVDAKADDQQHPLLGSRLASPLATQQYSVEISARHPAFLADHQVMGEVVYPAAAYIEAALSAAARHFGQSALRLCDIEIMQVLPLTAENPRQLQLLLTPQADECSISIHSCDPTATEPRWLKHIQCRAMPLPADGLSALPLIGPALTQTPGSNFYQASRERGIDYGPAFQTLNSLENCGEDGGQANYSVSASHASPHYLLPPVLFDTALQALAAARPDLGEQTWIPAAIAQLDFTPGSALSGRVVSRIEQTLDSDSVACSVQLYTEENQSSLTARGIRMKRIKAGQSQAAPIWLPCWVATPLPVAPGKPEGHWLLLGDDAPAAAELAQGLRTAGCTATWLDNSASLTADWLAAQAFSAVCCLALQADTLAAPACRELALIQQLGQLPENAQPTLLLVTRGAQAVEAAGESAEVSRGALWGLARVARNEFPALRCRCIDLDPIASRAENNEYLLAECASLHKIDDPAIEPEDQLAWRQKTRHALRLHPAQLPLAAPQPVNGRLHCTSIGDLDSLSFIEQPSIAPGAGEIQVRIRAASLNFKDVLHALGMLPMPEHSAFGFDAAGVVSAVGADCTGVAVGDRVMLSLTPGTLGSTVNARRDFVCHLPAGYDFASAAALPLAYLTAWHALVNVAQLQAGEHILIHAAAGGVGQAAVAIARLLGAQVHATANPAKQEFLRQAGLTHIHNSRSTAFRDEVLAATAGQGVDVVLNCLNGELIAASFATLKAGGRFVEIGKAGIWSPAEALACRPDVTYTAFDLADVASAEPAQITQMFGQLSTRLAQGQLPALPLQAYPATQVAAAFRLISRSRHIGKVVVTFPAGADAAGVQLITGGFGALSRLLCKTLVARGEKQLALLVRNPPNDEQRAFLSTLGADIRVATYPVTLPDAESVRDCVQQIGQDFVSPISAVYHAAGVLADAALAQQTPASFARVAEAKLLGAWHLHAATRHLDLRHFVLFSSAAALIGTPGQASYAVANAGLDALAAARRGAGLNALSVNWGPWGDGGMAARLSNVDQQRMRSAGITPLAAEPAWQALFQLADASIAQALVMNVDWSQFVARLPTAATGSLLREVAHEVTRTAPPTAQKNIANAPAGASPAAPGQLLSQISARPAGQRRQTLFQQLQQRVAGILGRPQPEEIPTTQGFFAMGMDSLTSMELRMSLQRELAVALPATLLFDYGSIEALTDYLLAQIPAWQAAPETTPTLSTSSDELAQLSEAELAEMLARELQGN